MIPFSFLCLLRGTKTPRQNPYVKSYLEKNLIVINFILLKAIWAQNCISRVDFGCSYYPKLEQAIKTTIRPNILL